MERKEQAVAADSYFGVLTGDIVSSSRANIDRGDRVLEEILAANTKIKAHFPSSVHADIDIFRGDSWQLVARDPLSALRIAIFFRALLHSSADMDSRVAIGYGKVDYLPDKDVSTGTGEAYTLSGLGLKDLLRPVRMMMKFPRDLVSELTMSLDTISSLIDLQVQRWTQKQAEAVAGALVGLTQQQIADSWVEEPVSQQAISQHLDSAGWHQIKGSLQFVEAALISVFRPHG
jgi:hypothetical protein